MSGERGGADKARELDRIQREAQRHAGTDAGGLSEDDLHKLQEREQLEDYERTHREAKLREDRDRPEPSILDTLEPPTAEDRAAATRPPVETPKPATDAGLRSSDIDRLKRAERDADLQRMIARLRRPETIRIGGAGLSLLGLLLLLWGLNAGGGQAPGATSSSAPAASAARTAAPAGTPIAQASPQVNGTGTATASFTKVSGPCKLASQFTDRYAFAATNGALTLTQLSDNHVTMGRIETTGDFTTAATGQSYRGRVVGTSVTGQHMYTAEGCNEVYNFTMTFPSAFMTVAAPAAATIAAVVLVTSTPQAAPTAIAVSTGTSGPNLPLSALGLLLVLGGAGVAWRGPSLIGAGAPPQA